MTVQAPVPAAPAAVTEPTPEPAAPAAEAAATATPADELGEGGKKALDTERTARKALEKELAAEKARVKEFEDRDKTTEQKQAEETARLRAEVESLTRAKTLAEVGGAAGIPTALLAGPASGSAEDVQAYADALSEWRGKQDAAPAAPAVVPTIGQVPAGGNVSIHDQIAAAEAAGDKATVAALKAAQLGAS